MEFAKYIVRSLTALKPPGKRTVSQWAEQERVLDRKSSSMPGRWRNDITPFLVDIMDEMNNYTTEEIVFCKPTQTGGTEVLQNVLGAVVCDDPSPVLIVYPSETLAESISENRLQPMIKLSPEAASKFHGDTSTRLELQFDDMYVSLVGSNSPSALASKPIRVLLLDEVDKYPPASKREADPVSLAEERTKTFVNRKIFKVSTPTLRTGAIWKALEACDIEKHYFVPCPHCGQFIELSFSQVKWKGKDEERKDDEKQKAERAQTACYICQCCGCVITDADKPKMLKNGEWKIVRGDNKLAKKIGYRLNSLYSPFVRFSEAAAKFMESKSDPEKLQNFVNSWLAEVWEDTKIKASVETVLAAQTALAEFTVPDWTKIITAGVDVQENCVYYVIRAWGNYMTSQLITRGQALSLPMLDRIMNAEYLKENKQKLVVALCLVDSGDQTDAVYDYCVSRQDWAAPSKGVDGKNSHYTISKVNKEGSNANGLPLVLIDGGKYKDMISARLRMTQTEGSWRVFNGIDTEYCEQVTNEHKITERTGGREKLVWRPKFSHAPNHYLDCEVGAFCAADILGVRSMHLSDTDPDEKAAPAPAEESTGEEWIEVGKEWL